MTLILSFYENTSEFRAGSDVEAGHAALLGPIKK